MYLSSHTRGIPKKSGPSDQFRTYSGPLLALRSGSGPSPEFRTFVVPLQLQAIVNQVMPELEAKEEKRRKKFYEEHLKEVDQAEENGKLNS